MHFLLFSLNPTLDDLPALDRFKIDYNKIRLEKNVNHSQFTHTGIPGHITLFKSMTLDNASQINILQEI